MPAALTILPNVLNTALTVLASLYFYHTFAKTKRKLYFWIVLCASLAALSAVFWLVSNKALHFVLMVGVLFGLTFCFDMKMLHRVLLAGSFAALLGVADVAAYLLQILLFKLTTEQTLVEPYYTLGVLQTFAILFLVLFIIHHARHRLFASTYNKQYLVLFALPVATLLALWTEYVVARDFEIKDGQKVLLLANAGVLLVTNFIIFYFADSIYDKLESEYRLRVAEELIVEQHQQYASLLENNSEIRQLRHDQKSFVLGALTELRQQRYKELEDQLNGQIEKLKGVSYQTAELPILGAIVEYKSRASEGTGAVIECSTRVLSEFAINDIDFAILLGNLLDNSLEAVSSLPEGADKTVKVFVEVTKPQIIVSVTNAVIKDIDVERLQTTKKDKKNHGYGLLAVRRIVDKYNGTLLLHCQNNTFEASAVLNQKE